MSNEKNKKSLPSKYGTKEYELIELFSKKMRISKSLFQYLAVMYLITECEFLDEFGELTRFMERASKTQARWRIHKEFLSNPIIPNETRATFQMLLDDYSYRENKQ